MKLIDQVLLALCLAVLLRYSLSYYRSRVAIQQDPRCHCWEYAYRFRTWNSRAIYFTCDSTDLLPSRMEIRAVPVDCDRKPILSQEGKRLKEIDW